MVSVGHSVHSYVQCADLLSTREGSPSKGGYICTPLNPPGSTTEWDKIVDGGENVEELGEGLD